MHIFGVIFYASNLFFKAVQHERQARNSATLRPENLSSMDSERILREAVGVFGYAYFNYITSYAYIDL